MSTVSHRHLDHKGRATGDSADDIEMYSAAYADTECSSQQDCCVELKETLIKIV